jgi:protein-tyrosine kinase
MGKIHKALEKSKKEHRSKTKSGSLATGGPGTPPDGGIRPEAGERKASPAASRPNSQKFDLGTIHDELLHDPAESGASNFIENQNQFQKENKDTSVRKKSPSVSIPTVEPHELKTKKNEDDFESSKIESVQKSIDTKDTLDQKKNISVDARSIKTESPVSGKKRSFTAKPETEKKYISVYDPINSSPTINETSDNKGNFINKKGALNVFDREFEVKTADGIVGNDNFASADSDSIDYNGVDSRLVALSKPRSYEAEQFKILRTNLLFPESGKAARSILITSAAPGDGKSFVAANLAVSLALRRDRKVMLIDADVRRSEIHNIFGLYRSDKGICDFLSNRMPLTSLLVRTPLKNLLILPAGKRIKNPSELQSLEKLPKLIEELAIHFSDYFIVIDSPPPKLASETGVLARLVDSIVVIVKAGVTKREYIEETIDLLEKEKITGIVFNWHDYGMFDYKKYVKNREYYS